MSMNMNQFRLFLIVFVCFASLAVIVGVFFIVHLRKRKQVIKNNRLVSLSRINNVKRYLPISDVQEVVIYSKRLFLQEFEPGLANLECIPSGKVSKLFLNSRGSWRLTQGNILTSDYLHEAIRKENKRYL